MKILSTSKLAKEYLGVSITELFNALIEHEYLNEDRSITEKDYQLEVLLRLTKAITM